MTTIQKKTKQKKNPSEAALLFKDSVHLYPNRHPPNHIEDYSYKYCKNKTAMGGFLL
uniref:Uncharacterized protein n=1 Tax=Anguilla anguilla TaxID=7936 RepID=A0A0E9WWX1_ANGAN